MATQRVPQMADATRRSTRYAYKGAKSAALLSSCGAESRGAGHLRYGSVIATPYGMRPLIPSLARALALAVVTLTMACGESPSSPTGTASLSLHLTDSPFSDAKAVLVTFSEVTVHRTGGGFTRVPFSGTLPSGSPVSTRTCDLKKLEGPEDVLGAVSLASGSYTQIRLAVSAATLYFDSAAEGPPCAPSIDPPAGASAPVTVPSGAIRLNRPFELEENTATTVRLDFDGDKSIHQTGNGMYKMEPVIAVLSVQWQPLAAGH